MVGGIAIAGAIRGLGVGILGMIGVIMCDEAGFGERLTLVVEKGQRRSHEEKGD